jgi:hypothetical protein
VRTPAPTPFARLIAGLAAAFALLTLAPQAKAIFHTFAIVELFSTADGSVQFVELKEQIGASGQHQFAGVTLTSTSADGTITRTFTFPSNLPSTATGGKSVLIATTGFGSLAGAVTPDYTLPVAQFPSGFLFPGGGTINFGGVSVVTYGPLPTNGQNSVNQSGVSAVNSPRNFAGAQGSINIPTAVNGRCCAASGACTITTQANCAATWTSGGACDPNPCPQPATGTCCRGCTCALTTAGACTGSNTLFVSASSVCNAAGSNTQPCCKADYNKQSGVELLDIFAFLNDWFNNVPAADFNAQNGVDLLDIFGFLSAWFAAGC